MIHPFHQISEGICEPQKSGITTSISWPAYPEVLRQRWREVFDNIKTSPEEVTIVRADPAVMSVEHLADK